MPRDRAAHAAWIREAMDAYEQPLVRYAMQFTRDADRARDVVQDAFLKLCREDRGKLNGRLAPWLYTVCRNRALDVRKKESRMHTLEPALAEARPDTAPTPSRRAETNEEHALVLEAVAGLPANQQEAFRLKFEHGMTYREIGEVMNMPLSTVSYTLTQALGAVRARVKAHLNPTNLREGA